MPDQRVFALAALLLAAIMFTNVTDSWASSASGSPPVIKLVGPESQTEHLTAGKPGIFTAIFNLMVENDGQAPIPHATARHGGYEVGVVSDRSYPKGVHAPAVRPYLPKLSGRKNPAPGTKRPHAGPQPKKSAKPRVPPALAPGAVTAVPVILTVHDLVTTSVTVVVRVTSPLNVIPVSEPITLTRSPKGSNFFGILGGSLALGLGVLALAWLPFRRRDGNPGTGHPGVIYTDATFSFSQKLGYQHYRRPHHRRDRVQHDRGAERARSGDRHWIFPRDHDRVWHRPRARAASLLDLPVVCGRSPVRNSPGICDRVSNNRSRGWRPVVYPR